MVLAGSWHGQQSAISSPKRLVMFDSFVVADHALLSAPGGLLVSNLLGVVQLTGD